MCGQVLPTTLCQEATFHETLGLLVWKLDIFVQMLYMDVSGAVFRCRLANKLSTQTHGPHDAFVLKETL